jgi:predicted secreted protein
VRSLKSSVVRFVSRKYVPKQGLPGRTGTGGTYILRFRAVAPGTTALVLAYTQSGNTKAKAASKYTLHLAVKQQLQPA